MIISVLIGCFIIVVSIFSIISFVEKRFDKIKSEKFKKWWRNHVIDEDRTHFNN